ncbi:MAG: hypothetical protein Q8R37_02330 [Nanoarchaeota archaeon]|nr:hypothetical protein [Nanoarchaeota archaeon]
MAVDGRTIICYYDNGSMRVDYKDALLNIPLEKRVSLKDDHLPARAGEYLVVTKAKVNHPQLLFYNVSEPIPCLYYLLKRIGEIK